MLKFENKNTLETFKKNTLNQRFTSLKKVLIRGGLFLKTSLILLKLLF